MKNQKGITLIALVITIIVLLILAGVSIAMLTGPNGLLTRAGNAKDDTAKAAVKEKVELAIQSVYADSLSPNKTVTVNATSIAAQYLLDHPDSEAASPAENTITLTDNGTKYKVTLVTAGSSAGSSMRVNQVELVTE